MDLIKNLFKLIIVFFIIDSMISFAFLELSKLSKIRYSRLYYEKINADVIFIGNSRGRNSFDSPYFETLSGKKSISLSYNALPLSLVKVFLGDYLERNTLPEIIFIEVHCISDAGYYGLLNFKQYMFNSVALKNMIKKYYPIDYYASMISKSYIFNSEYFIRTLYHITKNDQSWINRFRISQEYYNNLKQNEDDFLLQKIDESSMKIFTEIVQKYKGITIIPVLAPIIDKCRNDENINSFISDFESRTQLKIINYSQAISDISMFADTIHTNDAGARFITKKLYDFINADASVSF